MVMISFEFFCHKKEEPNNVIQLIANQEGFVQLPEKYEGMFQNGEKIYEGLASINGKNLLDPSTDPFIKEEVEGCLIISPSVAKKETADNALMSNLLDEYSSEHDLSVPDKVFLQKILLSLNEKLAQTGGCVYVNLMNCENAPLVLDAAKSIFEGFDILFTLPKNLKFAVPLLKIEKPKQAKAIKDNNLALEDGYHAFFDDICGIASPDLNNIQKEEKKKSDKSEDKVPKKPAIKLKKPAEVKNNHAEKPVFLKPGSKIEKAVKKDLGGDVLFSFLFLGLSIAAPYFYFGLLSESANVYFVLYLTLNVFFLIMCSVALCYVTDGKSKVTKGYYYLGLLISPTIEVLATVIFLFIAKSQSWLGSEAYVFFGIGLGYIILDPLVLWIHKQYKAIKKKAKAKK